MDKGRIIAIGSPRELISMHIEPNVVEVHGPGLEAWAEKARKLAGRLEIAGETAFCYAVDEEPVVASLKSEPQLIYLHRPRTSRTCSSSSRAATSGTRSR